MLFLLDIPGGSSYIFCRCVITIQKVVSREVFWHIFAKIPRHIRQNAITEGDLECILTRNCEGTEQLRCVIVNGESSNDI